MAVATAVADRLAEQISGLGGSARGITSELSELGEIDSAEKRRAAKRVVNTMAEKMIHFAVEVQSDTPVLSESFGRGVRSLQRAAMLVGDFQGDPTEQLETSLTNVRKLRETVGSTAEAMASLRASIAGVPRLTTRFNRAKKDSLDALDELGNELTAEGRLLREVELLLESFLDRS